MLPERPDRAISRFSQRRMRGLPMLGCKQRRTTEWALRPFFFPNFLEMDTRSGGFLMKEDELNALLAPLIRDLGLELVGIEFVPGRGGSLLRVYVDAPERPVTLALGHLEAHRSALATRAGYVFFDSPQSRGRT